ncbi:MAG TPA: DNA alkylation repair protein [Lutibacter sp.]|nr:DNA alkylation repair protein [Lutibacter sp.]
MSTSYIQELQKTFQENSNPERAIQQAKYMKDKFAFYGLTSPERRKLQAPFLVIEYLPEKEDAFAIVKELWQKPQRELHYFAQELTHKYHKQVTITDIELYEYLITNNSWWDTVDFIAANLVGNYFKQFPNQREIVIKKWMGSGNMWLQRTCLIFQLKYKQETDTIILSNCINQLLGSKEFFINKAIGWVLREYSKTNARWVADFVENHNNQLANLSKREALRILKANS